MNNPNFKGYFSKVKLVTDRLAKAIFFEKKDKL